MPNSADQIFADDEGTKYSFSAILDIYDQIVKEIAPRYVMLRYAKGDTIVISSIRGVLYFTAVVE